MIFRFDFNIMPQEGTILHKLGVDHQIFDGGGGGGIGQIPKEIIRAQISQA